MQTPNPASEVTTKVMRANKRSGTIPEMAIRQRIHRAGYRYSVDVRPEANLNTRADIVFRKAKVAVYVHGCFWHGCPKHYVAPKSNRRFWSNKVERNRSRDKETKRTLRQYGWKVLVFWEHENPDRCAEQIIDFLKTK